VAGAIRAAPVGVEPRAGLAGAGPDCPRGRRAGGRAFAAPLAATSRWTRRRPAVRTDGPDTLTTSRMPTGLDAFDDAVPTEMSARP
jgi:hypothetical protein